MSQISYESVNMWHDNIKNAMKLLVPVYDELELILTPDQIVTENGEAVRQTTPKSDMNQAAPAQQYTLSSKSRNKLADVIVPMEQVAELAIKYTTQDFTVFETIRTMERQRQMVSNGTSKTLDSKHLAQEGGLSHAMDLVPWIGGAPKWDWEGCYKIAMAVDRAATELGVAHRIIWGGCWDQPMSLYGHGGNPGVYKKIVDEYRVRHPGPDFVDGPHFEWLGEWKG